MEQGPHLVVLAEQALPPVGVVADMVQMLEHQGLAVLAELKYGCGDGNTNLCNRWA